MIIVSLKPKIPENYNAFCSATESNKQNPRAKTLALPLFFPYKHITSLKNHHSRAQGESLPYWFRFNFCSRVCLDLPVERIFFGCSL